MYIRSAQPPIAASLPIAREVRVLADRSGADIADQLVRLESLAGRALRRRGFAALGLALVRRGEKAGRTRWAAVRVSHALRDPDRVKMSRLISQNSTRILQRTGTRRELGTFACLQPFGLQPHSRPHDIILSCEPLRGFICARVLHVFDR